MIFLKPPEELERVAEEIALLRREIQNASLGRIEKRIKVAFPNSPNQKSKTQTVSEPHAAVQTKCREELTAIFESFLNVTKEHGDKGLSTEIERLPETDLTALAYELGISDSKRISAKKRAKASGSESKNLCSFSSASTDHPITARSISYEYRPVFVHVTRSSDAANWVPGRSSIVCSRPPFSDLRGWNARRATCAEARAPYRCAEAVLLHDDEHCSMVRSAKLGRNKLHSRAEAKRCTVELRHRSASAFHPHSCTWYTRRKGHPEYAAVLLSCSFFDVESPLRHSIACCKSRVTQGRDGSDQDCRTRQGWQIGTLEITKEGCAMVWIPDAKVSGGRRGYGLVFLSRLERQQGTSSQKGTEDLSGWS